MKKLYPCMVCEKRYAEMEQAEVCERKHEAEKADTYDGPADGDEWSGGFAENH